MTNLLNLTHTTPGAGGFPPPGALSPIGRSSPGPATRARARGAKPLPLGTARRQIAPPDRPARAPSAGCRSPDREAQRGFRVPSGPDAGPGAGGFPPPGALSPIGREGPPARRPHAHAREGQPPLPATALRRIAPAEALALAPQAGSPGPARVSGPICRGRGTGGRGVPPTGGLGSHRPRGSSRPEPPRARARGATASPRHSPPPDRPGRSPRPSAAGRIARPSAGFGSHLPRTRDRGP